MVNLKTNVRYIKGIGERRAASLQKVSIETLRDLVSYFPRAYDDRRSACPIAELVSGEKFCIEGMVMHPPTISRIRKGMELLKLQITDGSGVVNVTFFNQSYKKDQLHQGETYIFFGKVEATGRRWSMTNPVVEKVGQSLVTGRIVPIYPLTAGVTNPFLIQSMREGLNAVRDLLQDPLPDEIRAANDLCHISFAYEEIHFPRDETTLQMARRRLIFEELFLMAAGLRRLRKRRGGKDTEPMADVSCEELLKVLPFTLTGAQQRAIYELAADFKSGRLMNRLVQGDVGSGKTMVAAAALYLAVKNGKQAALMAPTSILAEQHAKSLAPLLAKCGVTVALLTGSTKAAERRKLLSSLALGEIDVLVGTHALFTEDVVYRNLGLVVTDEQHRFGVGQRAALAEKGKEVHLLVMSATPIPRTLALILYGDLDVSILDELPPGRQHIDTFVVNSGYHPRIYAFLEKEITAGRQAYVVCPLVEQDEEAPDERQAVDALQKTLQDALPNRRIAVLHGKMKSKEKESIMAAFAAGEADVLVSTTVVEVGVDVPNATVMVIENAERFGLSQLHQLRGRVGRGQHKSYCILVSDNKNEMTRARLQIMRESNNGFFIAEEDLRLRGPGDFFGQRQSGLPAMKLADISCDAALLERAREAAEEILKDDPELTAPEHREMALRIEELFAAGGNTLN